MLHTAQHALVGIKMDQLELQKLGILRNVWELTGKFICFSFAVSFLLGSIKLKKGKSRGEASSVLVSPLEPLEGFLGFLFQFLGCCRANQHR